MKVKILTIILLYCFTNEQLQAKFPIGGFLGGAAVGAIVSNGLTKSHYRKKERAAAEEENERFFQNNMMYQQNIMQQNMLQQQQNELNELRTQNAILKSMIKDK